MIRTDATAMIALVLGIGASLAPAQAQLVLPGATNGAVVHHSPRHFGGSEPPGPAPLNPIEVKAPEEDTILGQTLTFDGAKGMMRFSRVGDTIALAKLDLPGQRLSKPGEACDVDIVAEQPIIPVDIGHPAGATRWTVDVAACPFTADILDGAVLVSSARPYCDFQAADCRVNPIGLWGPQGDSIPDKRIKELERERVRAETTMRSNFKVLLRRAGKDKAAVHSIVGEQAAFSSEREVTCRDYAGEAVHGFCSAQITKARSLAILSEFAAHPPPPGKKKQAHVAARKPRPRSAAPAEAAPPQAAASPSGEKPPANSQ
jgi:hypothetical protein